MLFPRSDFGNTNIDRYLTKYGLMKLQHADHPPMNAMPGSPALKNQQLAFLLMDLRLANGRLKRFRDVYGQFESYTLESCLEFVTNRNNAADLLLDEFLSTLKSEGLDAHYQTAKAAIDKSRVIRDGLLKPFLGDMKTVKKKLGIHDLQEVSKTIETGLGGLLGELYMSVALPGAVSIGQKVGEIPEVREPFLRFWEKLKPEIKKEPGLLENFQKQYPELFSIPPDEETKAKLESIRERIQGDVLDAKLEFIKERILGEELDLVRIQDGVLYLGEAKLVSDPINYDDLQRSFSRYNRLDQLESKKLIADLLRAEAGVNVRTEYMSSAGFDPQLAKNMRHDGWTLRYFEKKDDGCNDLLRLL